MRYLILLALLSGCATNKPMLVSVWCRPTENAAMIVWTDDYGEYHFKYKGDCSYVRTTTVNIEGVK